MCIVLHIYIPTLYSLFMKKLEKQLLEELDIIEKNTDDEDIKQRVRNIRKLLGK